MKEKSSNSQLKVDGKMTKKGADKVGVIMAWGKSIAIVISSLAGLIIAVTAFLKYYQ